MAKVARRAYRERTRPGSKVSKISVNCPLDDILLGKFFLRRITLMAYYKSHVIVRLSLVKGILILIGIAPLLTIW
jgi:hypothetical protein